MTPNINFSSFIHELPQTEICESEKRVSQTLPKEKSKRRKTNREENLSIEFLGRPLPSEIAFLILDQTSLNDHLCVRLASKGDRICSDAHILHLSNRYSKDVPKAHEAFVYVLRVYQAAMKVWMDQPLGSAVTTRSPDHTQGPFLTSDSQYNAPSEPLIQHFLEELKTKLAAENDSSWGPWIWQLCKTFPREAQILIPFLSNCLNERKTHSYLSKDSPLKDEIISYLDDPSNPAMSNALLHLIATYLFPDILIRSIDNESEHQYLIHRLVEADVDLLGEQFTKALADGYRIPVSQTSASTPLHAACYFSPYKDLEWLLEALRAKNKLSAALNQPDFQTEGYTPLMAAISCLETRKVKTLLKAGADPTVCDEDGNTVLHTYFGSYDWASTEWDPGETPDFLDMLLDALRSKNALHLVNARNQKNQSFVEVGQKAYRDLSAKEARLLLEAGAIFSPFEIVVQNMETLRLILSWSDCRLNQPGPAGDTALIQAVKTNLPEHLKLLLEAGADPNRANKLTGTTPLLEAIQAGNATLVQVLLEKGADPNKPNSITKVTPKALAYDKLEIAILDLLEKNNAANESEMEVDTLLQ